MIIIETKMSSFRFHLNIEKEYIILAIKKWNNYIKEKEHNLKKINSEFYIQECINVKKDGIKKSCILYCIIDNEKLAEIDSENYIDYFTTHLKKAFDQNKILVIRE